MLRQMAADAAIQLALIFTSKNQYDDTLVILDEAIGKSRHDSQRAHYSWVRGCMLEAKGDTVNNICEKRDNYKSAIAAYRRTAELDRGMFVAPGSARPETTWAVPAYVRLLKYENEREWMDGMPGHLSKTTIVRRKAAETLGRIGGSAQEALDALESALAQEELTTGLNAADAMKEAIKKIKMSSRGAELAQANMRIRAEVLRRLAEYEHGNPCAPAIDGPELDVELSLADLMQIAASADNAARARAICIIGAKKEGTLETCKAIEKWLTNPRYSIRSSSVYALGQIAAANKTTIASAMNLVPTFLNLLRGDVSLHVRKAAAEALGAVGTESNDALQGLIQVVEKGYDPEDRYGRAKIAAIEALGQFGAAALAAVPHIRKVEPAGRDQREESLMAKYEALLRIAPNDREIVDLALPEMIAQLQSVFVQRRDVVGHSQRQPLPNVRFRAIKALGTVEPKKERRILALVKSLWMDESAENRRMAAESLQKVDHELAVEAGILEAGGWQGLHE